LGSGATLGFGGVPCLGSGATLGFGGVPRLVSGAILGFGGVPCLGSSATLGFGGVLHTFSGEFHLCESETTTATISEERLDAPKCRSLIKCRNR
jgi:hypothetical protein